MREYYQLVQVTDARRDSDAILSILTAMDQKKLPGDLRLLNYYREMPVSYPASLLGIDQDMVELGVHKHQAVAMKAERNAILKSSHFPHDVLAKVFTVKVEKSLALVTNFAYAVVRAERRRFVRVEISEQIEAGFRGDGLVLTGSLADISVGGVSILAGGDARFTIDMPGTVLLKLPSRPLEVPARLYKIHETGDRWRYVFELTTAPRTEMEISQFIFQRQTELIREIKEGMY